MAKFKILATGNIAGLKKRFNAGYHETQDENEIDVLSKNKAAAMLIIEPMPAPIEEVKPVVETKKIKEVSPVGNTKRKTR